MSEYKVSLSIGYINASQEDVIEIDDDELNDCKTDEERETLIWEYWRDWSGNYIDGHIEKVKS